MKTNLLNNIAKGEFSMAQIADVIKYEGDNTTFIWKSPLEDFNSMTQLIVHESQEGIGSVWSGQIYIGNTECS